MKQKSVIVAMGLISALAVTPVLAQTNTTSSSAVSTGQWMTHPDANQWLVSHLKGLDVYSDQNQKVGGIDELLSNPQGQIQAVVLDVGGFLGVGVHRVAVPFNQLHFVNTPVVGAANTAANTPAVTTRSANAPGNPMANDAGNTGLGSNPAVVAPNTPVTRDGTVVASNAVTNNHNPNVPDHAMLSMTQDQLKNAPAFNYNNP